MLSVRNFKMSEVNICKDDRGASGLFGFAVRDYMDKKGITNQEDLGDKSVVGFIITRHDDDECVDSVLKLCDTANVEMIIIGYHEEHVRDYINKLNIMMEQKYGDHYEELEDVYESRDVYIRKCEEEN